MKGTEYQLLITDTVYMYIGMLCMYVFTVRSYVYKEVHKYVHISAKHIVSTMVSMYLLLVSTHTPG